MFRTLVFLAFFTTGALFGQSAKPASASNQTKAAVKPAKVTSSPYRYNTDRVTPRRARLYYELGWGISDVSVKSVESGELIRFSYSVIDATKAKALHDKKLEPALYGERSRVKLVIPSLEKVGQLRQSGTPEAGKSYWMAFSNKGGYVKKGDRVTVVIGNFRAIGLIVQ